MRKRTSIFLNILIIFIFIFSLNIFEKITSDFIHLFSINILILLNFIISTLCLLTINLTFKKFNFQKNKEFQKNIQNAVANSFFISSIISIVGALIIYCFLKNILGIFNIKEGIINYANFAAKIWFVSSPFIGLELTIFKYFSKLDFFQKNIIIIISKLIIYYILSIILYFKFQNNCIVYAKPICDIIFLPYYTKICFDLTLKSNK